MIWTTQKYLLFTGVKETLKVNFYLTTSKIEIFELGHIHIMYVWDCYTFRVTAIIHRRLIKCNLSTYVQYNSVTLVLNENLGGRDRDPYCLLYTRPYFWQMTLRSASLWFVKDRKIMIEPFIAEELNVSNKCIFS